MQAKFTRNTWKIEARKLTKNDSIEFRNCSTRYLNLNLISEFYWKKYVQKITRLT